MKKLYLLIMSVVAGLVSYSQSWTHPSNIDIGLFPVGAHGSNTGLGASVEVGLRIKPGGLGYNSLPVADDYGVYLVAPKTDFTTGDVVVITEVNSAIYSTPATTVMLEAGVYDLVGYDANNLYFPIVLNSGAGMNLHFLDSVTNSWSFSFTFKFNNAKTASAINKLRVIDQNNNTAISNWNINVNGGGAVFTNMQMGGGNQLTPSALTALPVSLLNFSGYKNGSKNSLLWTTVSEQNNIGFDVQRSGDGVNYSSIGFVNTQALGGNSNGTLNYSFDDNSPVGKKNYYRLNQKDIDGRNKLSNIVMITGDRPLLLGIGGLFPNPTSTQVNVIIDAPQKDKVMVIVTDMGGKTVIRQQANVDIGSNTVPVDVAKLAGGSYLVKLSCQASDCETATAKFNKQ